MRHKKIYNSAILIFLEHHMRRILASFAFAAASLATHSANAAPIGFFELSNFRVEVKDLAPDDGVAADVQFNKGWDYLQAFQLTASGPGQSADGFNVPQASVTTPFGTAFAGTDGALYRTSIDHTRGWLNSAASFGGDFSVSPFTRAVFSFDWQGMNVQHAGSAGNQVSVESAATLGTWVDGVENNAQASLLEFGTLESGTLTLVLEAGADWMYGNLTANIWSAGKDSLPPDDVQAVPEPTSLAVMLAGLAGLIALRGRKAQQD